MPRDLPPLSTLRAFDAAAELGSFSLAAERLNLTHGAVSRAIKTLEDALGVVLFERSHRKVRLTRAGDIYAEEVRFALNHLRTGAKRIEAEAETGALAVTTFDSFAAKWLMPRLSRFRAAAPEIDLRLFVTDDIVDFNRDRIDIAIRFGTGPYQGLEAERLLEEETFPVCAPDLTSGPHALRAPADLRHHTLIHDDMDIVWSSWLAAAGVSGIDTSRGPFYNHSAHGIQAAIEGQGVALARSALVADDLKTGRLVRPFELSVKSPFAYWVVYPRHALERPKVRAFRDWAFSEVARDADTQAA